MNRQEKRHARIYALKMSYSYEMTKDKNNLHKTIDLDNDDFDNIDDILGYANRLIDIYIQNIILRFKKISQNCRDFSFFQYLIC